MNIAFIVIRENCFYLVANSDIDDFYESIYCFRYDSVIILWHDFDLGLHGQPLEQIESFATLFRTSPFRADRC